MAVTTQQDSLLTLRRSLEILDALAAAPSARGLGHATLARQLGFQRSTLYRYLSTLEQVGLVESDAQTHKYRLGARLLVLGAAALGERAFPRYAKGFVNDLAAATGETAHAAVYDGGHSVTIEIADGVGPVRPRIAIGARRRAHCSASGKIFLAYQPSTLLEEYLGHPLERRTAATITDPLDLRRHLEQVRRQGFAADRAEYVQGVCCVAAPVFDFRSQVAGSLSISVATAGFDRATLGALVEPLVHSARRFSQELGHSPRRA